MKTANILMAVLLTTASQAAADFYKYRDSSGAVVITDKLENVPPKYRNQFKVVWDKDLEAKDSLARRRAAAKEQQEARDQQERKRKEAGKKSSTDGKRLVITVDEETGQIIRKFE